MKFFTSWRYAAAACWLGLVALRGWAAEPPTEPILKVDAGMHVGGILAISADAQGRWAVTGGRDRVLRIWELASGRLVRAIHLPIGLTETEGQLSAVAMSPDANLIAAAGDTGAEWDVKSYSIYLLDRASGAIQRRITGLPAAIYRLAFSPNGSELAVGLRGDKKGLRLFSAAGGDALAIDSAYGGTVNGLSFSADGKRLLTASIDGKVRLYNTAVGGLQKLEERQLAASGETLFDVSMSPDGKQAAVAVRSAGTSRVDVISAETLETLFRPALDPLPSGDGSSRVAWSHGGKQLFAAGVGAPVSRNNRWLIRSWADSGRASGVELGAAADGVNALHSLPDGRILFVNGAPQWGIVAADGRSVERNVVAANALLDYSRTLLSSPDGRRVRLRLGGSKAAPVVFDVERGLMADEPGMPAPVTAAPGIVWTNSPDQLKPAINDVALSPFKGERAVGYAISPDRARVAVGGYSSVRMFDAAGKQLWVKRMPTVAWSVAFSGDGRWVIATVHDGTLRWFRAGDGKELLHVYFDGDLKRWVAWTPSGYYAAAPGAEDLIGWHINRGKDQSPDFFPVSRFRSKFYRPDVVTKIIEVQDEAEALRLTNTESSRQQVQQDVTAVLPPVVTISAPEDGSAATTREVRIKLKLRSAADAPITRLRVRINGQTLDLPSEQNLSIVAAGAGVDREINVTLPAQDADILIFAENKNGVSSPAALRQEWKGTTPKQESFQVKPKLYVLAVGVSKYQRQEYQLELAAKDATDFANTMKAQSGGLYREVEVKLLTDAAATRDEVVDALDWLRAQVTAKDVAMVFLAGHGINDADGTYYYLPVNADVEKLKRTGVVYSDIRNTLIALPGKSIFFVDSCHSGNVMGGRRAIGDSTSFVNELASAENGVVVFSSSTGKQYSLENAAWGNGAFTKALVEGIGGRADLGKTGRITHKMLDFYIGERVKELTKGQQTPVSISPFGVVDFPLAVQTSR